MEIKSRDIQRKHLFPVSLNVVFLLRANRSEWRNWITQFACHGKEYVFNVGYRTLKHIQLQVKRSTKKQLML